MPYGLQLAAVVGVVIISFAIFCAIFMIADSLHDRLSGRRRAPARPRTPTPAPPRSSPFAGAVRTDGPEAGEVQK